MVPLDLERSDVIPLDLERSESENALLFSSRNCDLSVHRCRSIDRTGAFGFVKVKIRERSSPFSRNDDLSIAVVRLLPREVRIRTKRKVTSCEINTSSSVCTMEMMCLVAGIQRKYSIA